MDTLKIQSTNRNDEEIINDGIDDKLQVPGKVIYIRFMFHQN